MSDQADSGERELIVRQVPISIAEQGDGRTLEARIVPFNTPVDVSDGGPQYTESWLPSAFEKQTRAADRVKVWLNFEHESGLRGIVGHGVSLVARGDALYGTFRVHNNSDGDKALQLVEDGLLTGISLEAIVLRSRRTAEGIVERVRAHLDKVSLVRNPAFEQAQVLALREKGVAIDEPEPDDPEPDEPAPDPEPRPEAAVTREASAVDEVLKRMGYEPLAKRAVSRAAWDGSPTRFDDEEYERSCLIDRGGDDSPKERCAVPVLEPNGDLNVHALVTAAAVLSGSRGGVRGVSRTQKATAARRLVRLYGQAGMTPPQSLVALATR